MAKIVFMGTPDFAIPTLKALMAHHDVIGVVTQPDRPAGRRGDLKPPPVKLLAQENGIPVFQPEKVRRKAAIEELKQWQPDVYVVAAFGQILPQTVLDIPPYGSINVHASLLPRWRGAAPIQAAVRAGDAETGVTIMRMDAGLDTGPMLSVGKVLIEPDETGQTLHDKLADLGADLLVNTLPGYLSGAIQPKPQPEEGVTYAPQIKKEEGLIDWTASAEEIERLVRAFTPWPGTFTYWNGKQLKLHAGEVIPPVTLPFRGEADSAKPGQVVEASGQIAIATDDGLYYPLRVQLAGKNVVSIDDFVRGYDDFVGSTLGA
jgi:methionyl-tRNA formyltransferase